MNIYIKCASVTESYDKRFDCTETSKQNLHELSRAFCVWIPQTKVSLQDHRCASPRASVFDEKPLPLRLAVVQLADRRERIASFVESDRRGAWAECSREHVTANTCPIRDDKSFLFSSNWQPCNTYTWRAIIRDASFLGVVIFMAR